MPWIIHRFHEYIHRFHEYISFCRIWNFTFPYEKHRFVSYSSYDSWIFTRIFIMVHELGSVFIFIFMKFWFIFELIHGSEIHIHGIFMAFKFIFMKFMNFSSKFIFMNMSCMTMNFHEPYEFQALAFFPYGQNPRVDTLTVFCRQRCPTGGPGSSTTSCLYVINFLQKIVFFFLLRGNIRYSSSATSKTRESVTCPTDSYTLLSSLYWMFIVFLESNLFCLFWYTLLVFISVLA